MKEKPKFTKKELFKKYIKFVSLPEEERPFGLKSTQDFIKNFDLTNQDIVNFEESPEFQSELNNEIINWARHKTPQLVFSLYKKFTTNRAKSSDLAQWMSLLAQAKYQTELIQFNFLDKLTYEQLEEIGRIVATTKSSVSKTS